MALFSAKSRVHGRLMVKGEAMSAIEGHQITLAFVPAQPGNPPLKKLFEPHIAGSCNVLTLARFDYEVELEPGHYQLFARCRRAAIDGPRLKIDERYADATPLPRAIEVKKGQPLLLNIPLVIPKPEGGQPVPAAPGMPMPSGPGPGPRPASSVPGAPAAGVPRAKFTPLRPWDSNARAVALVWASDDRIHVHPWRLRPGVQDRLNAQVPAGSRRAFDIAQQHMADAKLDRAVPAYRQALEALDPSLHAVVPEWLLELHLAIARNLLSSEGSKEALALMSPHFSRNKSLIVPLPTAVEVLGIRAYTLSIAGDLDVVERLTMQLLAMVLRGEGPRDNDAVQTAVEYRKKVLQRFIARAEPERLLEYLDKESVLLGDPAAQLAGGMARFEALVKLGRGGAAGAFGRKLLNNLELDGGAEAQEAIGTLRRELRSLMAGGDPNLTHSSASARRATEVAHAEKVIAAASSGRLDLLEALAKSHPGKFDYPAGGFRTALMMAASAGQTATVKWLVEHGARVGNTGSDSRNALLMAAESGHAEVLQFLLGKGAAVDHRDGSLQTALHLAAANNRAHAVLTLLQHRAPLELRDIAGDTPLTLCAQKDAAEVIPMLISAGAEVNGRGDEGVTALMKAARFGQTRVIEALLAQGADPAVQDDGGRRAIDWATRAQQPAAAKLLV